MAGLAGGRDNRLVLVALGRDPEGGATERAAREL
eukprot:CAMPEP_0179349752 /NCGR_PEP_ID=MMETSP0797-20121207/74401_1 /TAXON_ID=47934 /ORGANISM="Dinophysis acuminata, Strain DAEP01" /LENGTH=33 /DNA_ID= /DNA_START= /DNA_END= /DNA_ORIENTATION=